MMGAEARLAPVEADATAIASREGPSGSEERLARLRTFAPAPAPQRDRVSSRRLLVVAGGSVLAGMIGALLILASITDRPWPGYALERSAPPAGSPPAAMAMTASSPAGLVASGYVVARREATVAAEITGRVSEIPVEEGQSVRKGQLLARLDAGIARVEVAAARQRALGAAASVRQLAAELAEAQRVSDRSAALAERGFATAADIGRNQARVEAVAAQIAGARAAAAAAALDADRLSGTLRKYEIRAPFAGMVTRKSAQPGEIISPVTAGGGFTRTGICTLVDMSTLEIEAEISESFISRIRPGLAATAVLDAYPGRRLEARVSRIVPTASREKGTVKVFLLLLPNSLAILPNMAAQVTFQADDWQKASAKAK